MQTSILNKKKLPSPHELRKIAGAKHLFLIYDKNLLSLPVFAEWLAGFSQSLGVDAGESLKDIDGFPDLARRLVGMMSGHGKNQCALVAIGGGSVGDAVGFLASVIKRGVRLVHIPSTWLAAVDSAYGGKTALNVDEIKNQLGTFYPGRAVICVRELLFHQPDDNLISGYGEAQKMALIAGGELFRKFNRTSTLSADFLWSQLPHLARAKMRVVKRDPFEMSGRRIVLNLGHTYGHAIELIAGRRDIRLSHGAAVRIGAEFAILFGAERKITDAKTAERMLAFLSKVPKVELPIFLRDMLLNTISNDKKMADDGLVNFVFVKKPGQPIVKKVRVSEICDFAQSLGWVN